VKISTEAIKTLRQISGAGINDCQKALQETSGNIDRAIEVLRRRGLEIARKRQTRQVKEGRIESYVHTGNKVGVLVEVDCETDFVARNSEFCQFTKDVAMQITALEPLYIKKEDVPADIVKEQEQKEEFYKRHCLLEQAFIKDPTVTIGDYLNNLIAKTGENIVIRRFTRYRVGEE
jgi:elongation factor Ts